MIDVCRSWEMRHKDQMLGVKERGYKLWWSGKGDGDGGVEVMVKEYLCVKVVEVRRVSDDCCCSFRRGCVEVES